MGQAWLLWLLAGWLQGRRLQKKQPKAKKHGVEELTIPKKVLCAMENIVTGYIAS